MIDLTPVLQALAALAGTVVTAMVIPFIKGRISAGRLEQAQAWARIAVKAAEQLFPQPGRGGEKKTYVTGLLGKHGFILDTDTLGALIESAVNTLNHEKCKTKGDKECRS